MSCYAEFYALSSETYWIWVEDSIFSKSFSSSGGTFFSGDASLPFFSQNRSSGGSTLFFWWRQFALFIPWIVTGLPAPSSSADLCERLVTLIKNFKNVMLRRIICSFIWNLLNLSKGQYFFKIVQVVEVPSFLVTPVCPFYTVNSD